MLSFIVTIFYEKLLFYCKYIKMFYTKEKFGKGIFVKILILSCNTGEGHNAAGHAVEEAALARGHEVNFVDAMQLGKRHTSRLISGLYIGIVKHLPWFFGFIYKLGMLISNRHFKSPVYWANASWQNRLQPSSKKEIMTLW